MTSFWDNVVKSFEPVRKFFFDNYTNPVLWIAIFIVLFLLAKFIYSSLQKEK